MALREQVCTKRTTGRVKLLWLVPQAKEDLLHDLLGHSRVAQQTPAQPKHGARVAPVGLCERVLVVPADAHHQRGVADLTEVVPAHVAVGLPRRGPCARGPTLITRSPEPMRDLDDVPSRDLRRPPTTANLSGDLGGHSRGDGLNVGGTTQQHLPRKGQNRTFGYQPALDGVRALAIVLVLLF